MANILARMKYPNIPIQSKKMFSKFCPKNLKSFIPNKVPFLIFCCPGGTAVDLKTLMEQGTGNNGVNGIKH